jgi:transcriptional regulator with XRE-family HTH domain
MDLGAALRELRTQAGLTQERVEHLSGLHRTYVSSVERGERNASFDAITRWLSAVGASWTELGELVDRRLGKA